MTLYGSALTLFDTRFVIDQPNWLQMESLYSQRYDSGTQQKEVFDDLASLTFEDYRTDTKNGKEAFSKVVDHIA